MKGTDKALCLCPATAEDLAFARELTRVNMRCYYTRYGLIWQPEAFDAQWPVRESYLVRKGGLSIGFLGFTVEQNYLYLRDVQLVEAYRGEGVGGWVMAYLSQMARDRGYSSIRLKVFKNNPATGLYRKLGYRQVGEDAALTWMELTVQPS
ncbi:GNAT family N-acetyltransferase [Pseudomonas sp. NPDC087358]|uniref:GNAT family N-acetyltransferase n=1 Tax=Pseudomonas sp. NPDC087358 TaxID=3364439 RepID=UPI00384D0D93